MISSKDMFFDMRSEEMQTIYSPDFTKKQAEQTGIDLIDKMFTDGNKTPVQFFSNIARLKAVIDAADRAFRDRVNLPATDSYNGVTFTPKSGAESLNYSEDLVYADLENKLKQRAELLKYASKSDQFIYDHEGCMVPKVSKKFNKPSIVITF
jgi:hypothetical protein